MKLKTEREKKIYWEGYEKGKENSLKHNLGLMKLQLKTQKEFKNEKKTTKQIQKRSE